MDWRAKLAAASPAVQKQMLGEKLFPEVRKIGGKSATFPVSQKIVGMLLELENSELVGMLESEKLLAARINEAALIIAGQKRSLVSPLGLEPQIMPASCERACAVSFFPSGEVRLRADARAKFRTTVIMPNAAKPIAIRIALAKLMAT